MLLIVSIKLNQLKNQITMKTIKKVFFVSAIASLGLVACQQEKPKEEKAPGIALENMDTTVKPTDDFFDM